VTPRSSSAGASTPRARPSSTSASTTPRSRRSSAATGSARRHGRALRAAGRRSGPAQRPVRRPRSPGAERRRSRL
jgi:hypothetical protein